MSSTQLSFPSKPAHKEKNRFALWGQWIVANALAELIGLGTSALLWIAFLFYLEERWGVLVGAIVVVGGSTLLEGSAVGIFQWLVLRKLLPNIKLSQWWLATAVGAFVAWTLGMIPSTMMAMAGEMETGAAPPEMSDAVMYALAAAMGLVLGPILALPQWWVLRRYVKQAWLWIPANALAWAAGMAVIFVVVGTIPAGGITPLVVGVLLGGLAMAGAVVGASHGVVLTALEPK